MRELHTLRYFVPLIAWALLMSAWPYLHSFNKTQVNTFFLPECDYYLTLGQYPFIYKTFKYDNPWVFLMAAVPYTFHFLVPIVFGLVITLETYFKTEGCKTMLRWRVCAFYWTFGMANLLGVLVQWCFPTAPPWWYDHHHPGDPVNIADTIGDPALLGDVDRFLGVNFFHNLYSRSTIVFGSYPSLHAAWPFIACYFTINKRHFWKRVVWPFYLAWIWWAAIYLKHHFIVDVIGGVLVSAIAIVAHKWCLKKPHCPYLKFGGSTKEKQVSEYFHDCNRKIKSEESVVYLPQPPGSTLPFYLTVDIPAYSWFSSLLS